MPELGYYDKVIDLDGLPADTLRGIVHLALTGPVLLESFLTEDEIAAAETEELADA